jgi:predicted nucleotidyltransferase
VIDEKTGIRVDFIFSYSPYERQAIKRAKNVKLDETTVKFASLEDVIIHKIIAGRPRDIEDIKSILLKNSDYDAKYITSWLEEFDKTLSENFTKTFKKIIEETE